MQCDISLVVTTLAEISILQENVDVPLRPHFFFGSAEQLSVPRGGDSSFYSLKL